ncbi:MAG: hypothetical protein MJZ41_14260 [Bacteroidaceae bacterium]|nr:hypothetical protein [Bacteroidaceae bacterium]
MPQIVKIGKELICVNPSRNTIDYSTSDGRTWMVRYSNSGIGKVMDLLYFKDELLLVTSKGLYYSHTQGRTWTMRYNNNSNFDFLGLAESGSTLLATTSKGLYYSNSQGRTWLKR